MENNLPFTTLRYASFYMISKRECVRFYGIIETPQFESLEVGEL